MTLTGAVTKSGAQARWAATPVRDRLALVCRLRHEIARRSREFAAAVPRDEADTLVSEVLPLAEACRFLEREAAGLLAPRRLNSSGRPIWLGGVELEVRRDPLGLVLVIGPYNYPLFLPGVQAVQALVAGNAVLVKPGRGGRPCMDLLAECLAAAGLPMGLFHVLSEDPAEAEAAIDAGVGKVFLTGSSATGRTVLARLARTAIPSVMELSGDDSVYVLPGADIDLVVKAVRFGLRFNDGATCIAPKRVYAPADLAVELSERIPGIPVITTAPAPDQPALGATVFGPRVEAEAFARTLNAGVVVVNDMIVPTADPRVTFGGRGRSGFGLTRGAEGLLEMTAVKTIVVRRSRWLPHLDGRHPEDAALFAAFLGVLHGGSLPSRWRSLRDLVRAAMRRR